MKLQRAFLVCGVLSSLLYLGTDALAAAFYGGYYSLSSQTISELMARGAPTEQLVRPLFTLYGVLVIAFGVGVWMSAGANRALRATGALLVVYAVAGLPGPWLFQMNVRGSGNPSGDVPHIVLTGVLVVLLIAAIIAGAFALGRAFRLYSFATIAAMLVFGALVGVEAKGIATGAPTPTIGLTERANIGAFLLWIAVLAVTLLRAQASPAAKRPLSELQLEGAP